jgi:hypothetical protein
MNWDKADPRRSMVQTKKYKNFEKFVENMQYNDK